MEQLQAQMKAHLTETLLPFWKKLRDQENGGYYGLVDADLQIQPLAEKGCILNSRILWFFSNCVLTLQDSQLLPYAAHAYRFLTAHFLDQEEGGVYWSVTATGEPADTTKHTYNLAFAVYALSSYYDASKEEAAKDLALSLYQLMEEKCTDAYGYLEGFDRHWQPIDNDKLSENGVLAEKTMNTLLHVMEAYTELYRVTGNSQVAASLKGIFHTIHHKVYNPALQRQEVFFDAKMNSLLDLHSYGHDIESSWLLTRGCQVLGDDFVTREISPIVLSLARKIYDRAYVDHSLLNECHGGKDDPTRVWWVQAEAAVGFANAYVQDPNHPEEYRQAVLELWEYIQAHLLDPRKGGEWFWSADQDGIPHTASPIVSPWKCPYHNGRMCLELLSRWDTLEKGLF